MTRSGFVAVLLLAFASSVMAEDKKEVPKMPAADAKEWVDVKGADGLKMWDAKEGKGEAVVADATVTIHYTGWTTDGQVFDTSIEGGQPATFPLGSLIKGWQKGIPGMKPGGVRRLKIPSDLGYGDQGSPPKIPGGATLIFEIVLVRALQMPALDAKEWKDLKDAEGMKIWDVTEGKGKACPAGADVTIHYIGWLTDGTVFDSSHKRGQPATFPLPNLIQGWQKGVPGMKAGGIRRMSIPYPLAYGEAGRPPKIPEKATLIFEIELKEFDAK